MKKIIFLMLPLFLLFSCGTKQENFIEDKISVELIYKKEIGKNYDKSEDYKKQYFQSIVDLYDNIEEYKKNYEEGGENVIDEIFIYKYDITGGDRISVGPEVTYTKEALIQILEVLLQYPEVEGNVYLNMDDLIMGFRDDYHVGLEPEVQELAKKFLTSEEWLEKDKVYYPEHYERQEELSRLKKEKENFIRETSLKLNESERSEESKKYLTDNISISLGDFWFDSLAEFYDFIPIYTEIIKEKPEYKAERLYIDVVLIYRYLTSTGEIGETKEEEFYSDEVLVQIFEILSLYPDMEKSLEIVSESYILQNPKIKDYIEKFSKKIED